MINKKILVHALYSIFFMFLVGTVQADSDFTNEITIEQSVSDLSETVAILNSESNLRAQGRIILAGPMALTKIKYLEGYTCNANEVYQLNLNVKVKNNGKLKSKIDNTKLKGKLTNNGFKLTGKTNVVGGFNKELFKAKVKGDILKLTEKYTLNVDGVGKVCQFVYKGDFLIQ